MPTSKIKKSNFKKTDKSPTPPPPRDDKALAKKPFYKRAWFWGIVSLVSIGAFVGNAPMAKEVEETISIPCKTEEVEDPELESGQRVTDVACEEGEKRVYTTIYYKGGKETGRETTSEDVIREPVTGHVRVGTKEPELETIPVDTVVQYETPASQPTTPTPTPATETPTETQEDTSNLPFKATCKDGTIQYQDTPSHPNYQGMCSHHGGIAVKHGRVP